MADPMLEQMVDDSDYSEDKLYLMEDDELEKAVIELRTKESGEPEKEPEDEAEEDEDELEDEEDLEQSELEEDEDPDDGESEDSEEEDSEDADDVEEDEGSETDDGQEKEQPEDETKSEDNTETLRPVKANGMEIPVKSEDELYNLASMGVNYKSKMDALAPHRRSISIINEHGLTESDLSLLVDLKSGNKEALANFMQTQGVDPLDVDMETSKSYQQTVYGEDDATIQLKEIEAAISGDPEYTQTVNVVNKLWDQGSRDTLSKNPMMVQQLHSDIKQGIYEKVAPEAARLKFLDNGNRTELEYYVQAAQMLSEQAKASQELERKNKVSEEKRKSKKRKAATPTKGKATSKKTQEIDFENLSDEEYSKMYEEIVFGGKSLSKL